MNSSRPAYTIAPHVRDLPPSGIRRFFDLIIGKEHIISLGVGEPDFVTPRHIRDATIEAVEKGMTSYTSNRGLAALCEETAAFVTQHYNLTYDPGNEILITVGVSEAIDLVMRALLSPGDDVLVPEPCYVSYVPSIIMAGGTPVRLPLWHAHNFKLTPDLLEEYITPSTRVLLINYPSNPTGASYTHEELLALAEVIERHNIFVVSDEIYDLLTYDMPHVPFPSLPGMKERTLYVNGFSKNYAMTGYRLGYACGPKPVVDAMHKIHQYTIMCAPILSQIAGIEALRNGMKDALAMKDEYNRRRQFIVPKLNQCGLSCHMPEGAFYAFPSIGHLPLSSEDFVMKLLKEKDVAVVPGTAFGNGGHDFLRLSYATAYEKIEEAMSRIADFMTQFS